MKIDNLLVTGEIRGCNTDFVENLWDKYAVSSRDLEAERTETLKKLDGFLKGLGYLEAEIS